MEQERTHTDVNDDFRERCVPSLEPILIEMLTEEQNRIDKVQTNGTYDGDEDSEQRVQRVRDLLKLGEFETLARYIIRLDVGNKEKRETMQIEEQVLYFVVLLNSYLFDDYVSYIGFLLVLHEVFYCKSGIVLNRRFPFLIDK